MRQPLRSFGVVSRRAASRSIIVVTSGSCLPSVVAPPVAACFGVSAPTELV